MTKCGCYDGPYSEDMPRLLVSVRCAEHANIPPTLDHSLMVYDAKGKLVKTTPRDRLTGVQSGKLKEIRQKKKYDVAKKVKK